MKKIAVFLKHEFLKMLPPTIYFFVVLHIILFARNLLAQEWGISGASSALATIGALVIGKSILIADAIPFFARLAEKRLAYFIAARTLLYWAIALLLQLLEELLPLLAKHDGVAQTVQQIYSEINWTQFWVSHLIIVVFLGFYTTITVVSRAIGGDSVVGLLMSPAPRNPVPGDGVTTKP